ncbi:LytTR family DNA-binding domain-containing protein [Mucilaginibacter sp.]|uniref:LytR/AlgR family response regulator transcription factor n=1 Tax=Mucilaginibacter sp. TaxID=1882438 RepID=UPI00284B9840|nr:LytTR family DNA-binding domain-containing protein [Mucilaginibacter sp.]MDR3692998.1 LytTR family DNA-binding domain-containing protein [Mucilaginibacter sp.]
MTLNKDISCIIVDDDLVDRLMTLSFLKDYPQIKVLGSYSSPLEALDAAKKVAPEVLFLDIDMPDLNGLQLRGQLMQIPACVFITSFPEYALDGYELEAFDFLVKPFTSGRFEKMMNRLNEYFLIRSRSELLSHTLGADTIFIKEGTRQIKLQLHEIIYLEAMKDYTSINTVSKRYMVLESLSHLVKEKGFVNFIQIHRSYAVQKHYIKQYNSLKVLLSNNYTLPVGRSFKETLQNLYQ